MSETFRLDKAQSTPNILGGTPSLPEWMTTEAVNTLINPDSLIDFDDFLEPLSEEREIIRENVLQEFLIDQDVDESVRLKKRLGPLTYEIARAVDEVDRVEPVLRSLVSSYLSIDPQAEHARSFPQHFGVIAHNRITTSLTPDFIDTWRNHSEAGATNNYEGRMFDIGSMHNLFDAIAVLSAVNQDATPLQSDLFRIVVDRQRNNQPWRQELEYAINWGDSSKVGVLNSVREAAALIDDKKLREKAYDVVKAYLYNHNLGEAETEAYIQKVIPRIIAQDPALLAITKSHGAGDIRMKGYGQVLRYRPEDFCLGALISKVTPTNVRELLEGLKDIPTSDRFRIEQNRIDALRFPGSAGEEIHSLIHDDKPGAHDAVEAVAKYGRTGDRATLERAITNLANSIGSKYHTNWQRLLDGAIELEFREKARPASQLEVVGDPNETRQILRQDETIQSVLERLVRNTLSVHHAPPEVTDTGLRTLLQEYEDDRGQRQALLTVSEYINTQLSQAIMTEQYGLEPSFLEALAWIEHEQFLYLKNLQFEDQFGLHKTTLFKTILHTHELTHNPDYTADSFEEFTNSLRGLSDRTAAQAVFNRVLTQVSNLKSHYSSHGRPDWSEALWSGNVTHELLGLIDQKAPATAAGRRVLAQQNRDAGKAALFGFLR